MRVRSEQGLKNLIVEQFEQAIIPLRNIIGFASDNASIMALSRCYYFKKDLLSLVEQYILSISSRYLNIC